MVNVIRKDRAIRLTLRLSIATLTGVCLLLGTGKVRESGVFNFIGSQPASAQFLRPQDAGQQVYATLPNLPRENQYVSKETGKVNPSDTLVSRLIRYHIYVKQRPPNYRFDWKLTIADYIGANDYLVESQYPGAGTLRTNPMESDVKAIQKLNRSQRDALVNVLVNIFNINRLETPVSAPAPSTSSPAQPVAPSPSASPSLPKPGDARLLLP